MYPYVSYVRYIRQLAAHEPKSKSPSPGSSRMPEDSPHLFQIHRCPPRRNSWFVKRKNPSMMRFISIIIGLCLLLLPIVSRVAQWNARPPGHGSRQWQHMESPDLAGLKVVILCHLHKSNGSHAVLEERALLNALCDKLRFGPSRYSRASLKHALVPAKSWFESSKMDGHGE